METVEYKGRTIEIEVDEEPMNPRTDHDNLGTMVCFHGRYNLGDEHSYTIEETKELLYNDDNNIALNLYVYEHGGITMNTTGYECPWDSGQVGIIFVTKEKIRNEYKWDKITEARRKKIISYLKAEVSTYDEYLTGNVYGYITGDDSCWGFYGYNHEKSGLLEMAQNSIDCYIAEKKEAEDFADTIEFLEKRYQNEI